MASTDVLEKVSEEPDAEPPTVAVDGLRFVTVRANLMPEEVVVGRRVDALRRKIVSAVAALVLIIVAGYAASWLQTRSVRSDLDDLNHRNSALQAEQGGFGPLVRAQADVASVQTQLSTLMAGDLPWSSMLSTLRTQAPTGVSLTSVTGQVSTTATGGASQAVTGTNLNQSGRPAAGALTITGSAGNKTAVAAYSDRLGKVQGLTAPLITNVTAVADGVTFSVTVTITDAALAGRYSTTRSGATSTTRSTNGVK